MPQALVRYESPALLSSRRASLPPKSGSRCDGSPCSARPPRRTSMCLNPKCPPEGGATTLPLLRQVAMHNFGSVSLFVQRLPNRFRQHYRAMPPARAAKCNRQVALPFPDIMRDQISQQALDAPQEFPGLRKRSDVSGDTRLASRILAQLRNKMGIRQEAHVKDKVGVGRKPVPVSEAHERNHHRTAVCFLEPADDELPQFVNVELGRVDNHIGQLPDRLHQHALAAQAFEHRTVMPKRMRTPRLAEPVQ